jgi:hypothetical protein
MALVVVTDPFDPACNSYASVAGMNEYVTTRVADAAVKTAWDALTNDQQALYLVNSTRALDNYVEWIGDRYSRDQRLSWPRVNAYYDSFLLDQISFPIQVVEATYEMAIWSMQNDGVIAVDQNTLYDQIRVGPIRIDFNTASGVSPKQYFPDIVAAILKDLGAVRNPDLPSANTIKTVKLQRA